jgi:hypothetical protein
MEVTATEHRVANEHQRAGVSSYIRIHPVPKTRTYPSCRSGRSECQRLEDWLGRLVTTHELGLAAASVNGSEAAAGDSLVRDGRGTDRGSSDATDTREHC